MKKKVVCFIAIICLLLSLFSVPAFASSYQTAHGSAFANFCQCTTINTTWIYLSNITDDPVDVTITFYNNDGTLITDDGSASTGLLKCSSGGAIISNYSDNNSDSSITFTMDGHNTCNLSFGDSSTSKSGYGVIQWTQENSSVSTALVGSSVWIRSDSLYARTALLINGGMPF